MIKFEEDDDESYKGRTLKNASADVTIAFAHDFTTYGEVLTKKYTLDQNNLYIPVSISVFSDRANYHNEIKKVVSLIDSLGKDVISLNIAGNGIYTLKLSFIKEQFMSDYLIYSFLKEVVDKLTTKISLIRTGGQSGADESGAKAGLKLKLPVLVLGPKKWRFRDINNQEFFDEKLFKERFIINER